MKITLIEINNLNPAEYNPRQITKKQYEDLKASMEKFGCVDPIIININPERLNVVVGGHQRLKILRELGAEKVPTVSVNLSEEDERELNVRLNKSGGEWDMDILANEFDVVDLKEWGFKDIELGFNIDKIVEGNTEYDHIPEVKESRVKLGEVWELGKHRLMCGDSTKESDVNKLMNGEKADMVFTDPPYGISVVNAGSKKVGGGGLTKFKGQIGGSNFVEAKKYSEIIGDETTDTALNFYELCVKLEIENFIIWGGNYFTEFLPASSCWIVWDKENTGNFADVEMAWTNYNKGAKLYKWLWNGMSRKGSRKVEGKTRVHPTQKPVGMFEDILKDFTSKVVYDGFLGSGSTLIACEKTNRVCYGMELDTKYCDVIIERWEQFTGQKAKKCGQ